MNSRALITMFQSGTKGGFSFLGGLNSFIWTWLQKRSSATVCAISVTMCFGGPGYESSSISRIERGKANPTMALLIVMADVFHLRPSQLLSRAERLYLKNEKKRPGHPQKT
jgi:transcriptional regulator with XRE-family HTH domain